MIYDFRGTEALKDKAIFAAIIIFALVGVLDVFLPNADVILLARTLQAAGSAIVVVVYWPDFIEALRTKKPELGDFLIFGVTIGWMATFCQAIFVIVFRVSGNPWWFANSDLNLLWIAMSILSSVMHVIAPGLVRNEVPRRNRLGLGIGTFLGVFLACSVMLIKPDLAGVLEMARPYIADVFKSGASDFQAPEVDLR
ncbi:hypothetical protein [Methylobacterium sp. GC_Met_2]|uniref:hypothetical protein n=1 Tax=Methylobacterium sp. GC_Met_2 TaxID=2937376 RepID=UPI00226B9EBE|nr:hypothetical protein [Methylobacterium sp. GC_Met_2]